MNSPVLVILPDPDTRVDVGQPVLGMVLTQRLVEVARSVGVVDCRVAPGVGVSPAGTAAISVGRRPGGPMLVILESALIAPWALRRVFESSGEGSLFDRHGRPVAWWSADGAPVPAALPVGEALATSVAPDEIARLLEPGDRADVEALVLRASIGEADVDPPVMPQAPWRRYVEVLLLRWLCRRRWSPGQLELVAMVVAAASGVVAPWAGRLGLVTAALLLVIGTGLAGLVPQVRQLLGRRGAGVLATAVRPVGHASLGAGLTYALVVEGQRSGAAGVVLLGLGVGSVLLSLAHARAGLHGRRPAFALPTLAGLAEQLERPLPLWVWGPMWPELLVFVLSWSGVVGVPWGVLVAVGAARLWRWFAGHPDVRTE